MEMNQKATRESLPPVDNNVPDCKCDEGAALRCIKQQVGENRYPINSREAERKTHGPNN